MEILAPGVHRYRFEDATHCFDLIKQSELFKKGFTDYGRQTGGPTRVTSILNPNIFQQEQHPTVFTAVSLCENGIMPIIGEYQKYYLLEDLKKETEWLFMRYDAGDYFGVHKDEDPNYDRTLSVVAYLNDGYGGGEIEFPDFSLTIKPTSGDVLLFPSCFSYRHAVRRVTSGARYVVVNWFRFAGRTN